MIAPDVGQPAPDFACRDQHGNTLRLADLRGRFVVIFFYPKDGTPVCTAQACGFRDRFGELARSGATVIGVSPDSDTSHAATAARHHLPFALVSDADGRLARLFGVGRWLGVLPGRATFVIDPSGVIRLAYRGWWNGARHATEALRIMTRMQTRDATTSAAPR